MVQDIPLDDLARRFAARAFPFPPLSMKSLLPIVCIAALALTAPLRADLNSDLAFSAFQNVDLNALAGGQVLQMRGPIMAFSRGITAQSLFLLNAAPADVAKKLTTWTPASHSELKVWMHRSLPLQPTVTDFGGLSELPDNSSVETQYKALEGFDPAQPTLQVSKEEAQLIAAAAAQQKDPKALFAQVWPQILLGRIDAFLSGKGASSTDAMADGAVAPLSDVKSLLHADPKVYGDYQRLLNQTPARSLATSSAPRIAPTNLYYEVFDVEGAAAVGTGAMYQAANGNSIQSLDIEYYANSGVIATVELEQMWPIAIGGRNETLVWREDLVSAPNVAYLHGTERMASSMIMLQDTKQGIDAFRSEFK
jgi:hypothetical protein